MSKCDLIVIFFFKQIINLILSFFDFFARFNWIIFDFFKVFNYKSFYMNQVLTFESLRNKRDQPSYAQIAKIFRPTIFNHKSTSIFATGYCFANIFTSKYFFVYCFVLRRWCFEMRIFYWRQPFFELFVLWKILVLYSRFIGKKFL